LVKKVHAALPDLVIVILRPLPGIELARLACVNTVFWVALLLLRNQNPGRRYAAPGDDQGAQEGLRGIDCRLVRASYLGDVAVLRAVVAAGVDEDGIPLREVEYEGWPALCKALCYAAYNNHIEVAGILLEAGADAHQAALDWALRWADDQGNAAMMAFLIQHGAHEDAVSNGSMVNAGSLTGVVRRMRLLDARLRSARLFALARQDEAQLAVIRGLSPLL
jgi:hypothetical protein